MDELEIALEDLVKESRKRDTIAAVLISTALFLFGVLTLILLEILRVNELIRGVIVIGILVVTWISMSIGIYMLVSTPLPSPPARIVADLSGINALMKKRYPGKVYLAPSVYKKISPAVSLRMNIELVEVPDDLREEFKKFGELSDSLAIAKLIKAKYVVSEHGNQKINGIRVIKPDNFNF
jgi:hypothetical protein